jgi:menaquinone-specific isochorismate synthase
MSESRSSVETQRTPALLSQLHEQLDGLNSSETRFPVAISVPAAGLNEWQWLNANRGPGSVAWSDRTSSDVVAGVGVASSIDRASDTDASACIAQCRQILNGNSDLKFFGGFSFDGTDGWSDFGAGRFVIPRLRLSKGTLTLAVMDAEDIDRARLDLQQFSFDAKPFADTPPAPTTKKYSPTFDGWQSRIDEALSLIRSEVLEKIVLSRKTTLRFSQALNPVSLAERLHETTHDCFVFCFDFGSNSAFVGATPERLFLRQKQQLNSEVIAGTRMRGENSIEDERLAIELLTSDKDQREHDIVRKSIRQKLHKFVDHLVVDNQASILRLARKQHLRSNVQGTLKPEVDDGMLLKRLHPTPAVGGYPTENALPEIARIEPFNRGWYAAPVGWIGSDSAQFAVAIRSGLVEGDSLSLYSGAGIVRGSDPDQEWQEVENKIQDFISVLG